MPQLFLNFTDDSGAERRIAVDRAKFVIGRQPDCDLAISDSRLSRRHAAIESFGAVFLANDLGSSNGTTLGGERLSEPKPLTDGDVLDLGGYRIRVEIVADETRPRRSQTANPSASNEVQTSSIPTAVFIIAPLLAVLVLVCGGGVLWFTSGDRPTVISGPTPYETPIDDDTPTPSPTASATTSPSGSPTPTPSPGATAESTPPVQNESRKSIETNAAVFLQQIAVNDPSAFLKGSEIDLVAPKINSLKSSAALAENIKAARASAGEFKSLADSRGLKPQFLAAAALAQLGSTRGSPIETAKSMATVFGELRVTLANNLANDCLMMVAAFDQGRAGKFKDLRNQLEALGKKNPLVSPREIRTIWFLKKQGKLSDAEFDFALRFIAVGTIAQNPKEFGVNAEKLEF